jgi:membrane-bound lytic murein transglycosylase B
LGIAILAVLAACATTSPGEAHHAAVSLAPAAAATSSPQDAKFAAFIFSFRPTALAAGIRPEIYDASMNSIHRNPRVEQMNLQQPEFIKPVWSYLDGAVSDDRVANGETELANRASMLANLEIKYGVPKEILVAIWGMESNFGTAMGGFNMFEALATLAYDGPRQDYAQRELLAALKMEQEEGLLPSQMTSSWAGAFGNTQFVPSSFFKDAVDGDGDGRRDLWHSAADSLASTAALLQHAGWQKNAPWGYEITLPQGFAYELADGETTHPLAFWKKLGVRTVTGNDLPPAPSDAAIYLPGGWHGPAFILFDNFRVFLKYNNAASYALGVCYLADRMRGAQPIMTPWPRYEQPLTAEQRTQFQTELKSLGYDPGAIDGVLGRKVRSALRMFQKDHGMPADGFPTIEMLGQMTAAIKTKTPN